MIHSGSIAALDVGFSLYTAALFPLGPVSEKLSTAECILLLTAVNCLCIRVSTFLQNLLAVAKVTGLAGMILLRVMHGSKFGVSEMTQRRTYFESRAGWASALVSLQSFAYEEWHVMHSELIARGGTRSCRFCSAVRRSRSLLPAPLRVS